MSAECGSNRMLHLSNQFEIMLGSQEQRIVGNNRCFADCDTGLKTEFI